MLVEQFWHSKGGVQGPRVRDIKVDESEEGDLESGRHIVDEEDITNNKLMSRLLSKCHPVGMGKAQEKSKSM